MHYTMVVLLAPVAVFHCMTALQGFNVQYFQWLLLENIIILGYSEATFSTHIY